MKTNIRIQNKSKMLAYISMHLSQKLLTNYEQTQFSPLAGTYFMECLPGKGEIYSSLSDKIWISGLSGDINGCGASVTQRLAYHSEMRYELTKEYSISEISNPSFSCVKNNTDEVRAVLLFCGEQVIYYHQVPPNQIYRLPPVEELSAYWTISFISSSNELPKYFRPDIPELQPLWSGSSGLDGKKDVYMTFEFYENGGTGLINLTGPDFSRFPVI